MITNGCLPDKIHPSGFFFLIIFYLHINLTFSQEYVMHHYTSNDGLAGDMVYCCAQDKDGFMWFGTENGVSRFDGKNFVNYTTDDGLSDNEVLEIYSDSKGRTWFVCFGATFCYYYKGKIYNYKNDKNISPDFIPSKIAFRQIYEDYYGNLWLSFGRKMEYYSSTPGFKGVPDSLGQLPVYIKPVRDSSETKMVIIDSSYQFREVVMIKPGNVYINQIENIHDFNFRKKGPYKVIPYGQTRFFRNTREALQFFALENNKIWLIKEKQFPFDINRINVSEDGLEKWLSSNGNGACRLDDSLNITEVVIPGEKVSTVYIARNNNRWFTTTGHGVFLLRNTKIGELNISSGLHDNTISYLTSYSGNSVIIGYNDGVVQKIGSDRKVISYNLADNGKSGWKIIEMQENDKGELFVATANDIIRLDQKGNHLVYGALPAIKDFTLISDTFFLFANHNGVFLSTPSGVMDTILFKRATTVLSMGQPGFNHYIATIDSLYYLYGEKKINYVPEYDFKKLGRISDMVHTKNRTVFISSYNSGLIILKNGTVKKITQMEGILSNQCRRLYLENDTTLWLTCNRGFSKLVFDSLEELNKIHNFSSSDGFSSDFVSGVCKINDTLWVATDDGLNFVRESDLNTEPDHSVQVTSFLADNRNLDFYTDKIKVNRSQNVKITYSGISYSSPDQLLYKYRIAGLDDNWTITTLNEIELPGLPAGSYSFIVYVLNKNNIQSELPAIVNFEVLPAFWETLCFKILLFSAIVLIIYFLFRYRIRKIKQAELEKTMINKKFAELKLEAIRSQMDPHFIFNCLNAIQHFNIKEDYKSAQHFMSEFAGLIRKTLNHSQKDFILLGDEVKLLEVYIKLEKLRFEDLFDYEMIISKEIMLQSDRVLVPSLILQPFVENAINHGIKYLKNEKGRLLIKFKLSDKRIFIVIEDNGIGIEASKKIKQASLEEARDSFGLNLSSSRIDVINRIHDLDISFKVTDKFSGNVAEKGTLVEISLPLKQKD